MTHIGYSYWQQPEVNNMPEVEEIELPTTADTDAAIEDSERRRPDVVANDPKSPQPSPGATFVEANGYVSMEADNYTRAIDAKPIRWQRISDLGRTGSGMTTFPVTAASQTPSAGSPRLEYRVLLLNSGDVEVQALVAPTLDFYNGEGLRYTVSFYDQPPQIVNLHADESLQAWEKMVADNVNVTVSKHQLEEPGPHVLRFWRVDPGVVLQKLVVDAGGLEPSYLGPRESYCRPADAQ